MTQKPWLALVILTLAALPGWSQQKAPLQLLHTVSLAGVHGRIDHFDVDLAGHRLFMSALGNDTLEVFDLRTNRLVHTVRGLREPQGVTYAPRSNRIFVANGGDGAVRVFDGTTYRLLQTVHFPSDADDTRYDPSTRQVVVGFGDRGDAGLAFLDAATGKLVSTIRLPSHPESFQLETSGPDIFVNIPGAGNVVEVVNRVKGKIVATWPLEEARGNFPMALDEAGHRLFVVCRSPAELLVLNSGSGKLLARVPSVSRADDVWYGAARRRVYISGGGGYITVIAQQNPNTYHPLAQIKTPPGGRTSLLVPELHRLYLGIWGRDGLPEELQIYAVRP